MALISAGTGLLLLVMGVGSTVAAPFAPFWPANTTTTSALLEGGSKSSASIVPSYSTFVTVTLFTTLSPSSTVPATVPALTSTPPTATSTSSQALSESVYPLTTYAPTFDTSSTAPTASIPALTSSLDVWTTTSEALNTPGTATSLVATTSAVPTDGSIPPALGTMKLSFMNNLAESPVYAYLTGTDSNGQLVMLTQQGEFYYPSSSSDTSEPIPNSANVAITLNGHGQTTEMLIPNYITSARLWVSHKVPLKFGISAGGLVEPSAVNDDDPNHNTNWGFMEFTFNSEEDGGLYANLSFVDFIGLPLGMTVSGANDTQNVLGPHKFAKDHVCTNLKKQSTVDGQPWDQLCKLDNQGKLIRVVSPQTLITQNTSAFDCYFDDYVNAVWEQYSTTPLVIQTQSATGVINCTASGDQLLCEGDDTPFTKPNAGDIFGCASGPFANTGNDVHLAAVPRVCAAFNRATLHIPGGNVQPQVPPSQYYVPPATNFYSRFVHDVELDGKGYAFSYDDVSPNQAEYNTAGLIAMPLPEHITVYVGGYNSHR